VCGLSGPMQLQKITRLDQCLHFVSPYQNTSVNVFRE
jgi:hypothetical protein